MEEQPQPQTEDERFKAINERMKSFETDTRRSLSNIQATVDAMDTKLEPYIEIIEASRVVAKGIAWIGGVIIGIGAIYTALRQLFHL